MGVTKVSKARPLTGSAVIGQCVTYGPTGMPDVRVLVDEGGRRVWCPGRVHSQVKAEDAGWLFTVDYLVAGRSKTDTFPAQRVRGEAVAPFISQGR